MKTYYKISTIAIFLAIFLSFAPRAFAFIPTLSLTLTGTNSVQVTVYGDANSSVILYYRNPNGSTQSAGSIGTTNSNGYFSWVTTGNNYNIYPGAEVFVYVNNQQSTTAIWPYGANNPNMPPYPCNYPYYNCYQNNVLSFSQASVTLTRGRSLNLTPTNNVSGLYVSNNSNSYVASASVYSNQVTITANQAGSAVITLCAYNTNCATVSVTVENPIYIPQYPYYPYQYNYQYPYNYGNYYQNQSPIIYYQNSGSYYPYNYYNTSYSDYSTYGNYGYNYGYYY